MHAVAGRIEHVVDSYQERLELDKRMESDMVALQGNGVASQSIIVLTEILVLCCMLCAARRLQVTTLGWVSSSRKSAAPPRLADECTNMSVRAGIT
jgi:hypothetical protein